MDGVLLVIDELGRGLAALKAELAAVTAQRDALAAQLEQATSATETTS